MATKLCLAFHHKGGVLENGILENWDKKMEANNQEGNKIRGLKESGFNPLMNNLTDRAKHIVLLA